MRKNITWLTVWASINILSPKCSSWQKETTLSPTSRPESACCSTVAGKSDKSATSTCLFFHQHLTVCDWCSSSNTPEHLITSVRAECVGWTSRAIAQLCINYCNSNNIGDISELKLLVHVLWRIWTASLCGVESYSIQTNVSIPPWRMNHI